MSARLRIGLVSALPTALVALLARGESLFPLLFGVASTTALATWLFVERPIRRRLLALETQRGELFHSHTTTVEDLRRERDVSSSILETMQEGVLLLNQQDQIVLVNPALRSALLLSAEVIGQALQQGLPRAEVNELVRQARASGKPEAGELVIDGLKPRRLAVRVNPMQTPVGSMLVVFFDVTEIRRLESIRRDFVANVSHELRTPVTAICSATETLLSGALGEPGSAMMFVQIIERNSERLRRLVEDLLDLSRIESKEYKIEGRAVAVAAVVERSISSLSARARQGRVRTDVEIPSTLPEVLADDRALEQVLVNLIDNSIKYCPPGSRVVVKAKAESDAFVRISVDDSGPGIPEQDLPRLFERFYRVDPGRSRDMGGTGLGLSIVKHLVEAMGGEVGVTSRVGFGSCFWFTLPSV